MNKQELIEWMTEKRENLPFESKVQLIKDFWDDKKAWEIFSQKYGKTDLNGVEELIIEKQELITQKDNNIQDLEKDKQEKITQINEKDQKITQLKEQITEIQKIDDEEIAKLNAEITKKDDRIARLSKLFLRGGEILTNQYNYTVQLQKDLELEKKEKGIGKEKEKHLQWDIERLDKDKEELNKQIKELSSLDEESRKLRDKELQELKEKLTKSNQALAFIQAVDQQVATVLEPESQKTGLLLRSQEVIQKIKDLRVEKDNRPNITLEKWNNDYSKRPTLQELNKIQQQLQKEQSWWDKWINDDSDIIENNSWNNRIPRSEVNISFDGHSKIYIITKNNYGHSTHGQHFNETKKLAKIVYEHYRDK